MKRILITLLLVLAFFSCEKGSDKALLVVSFGSSYTENRIVSIDATEEALYRAFPDYDAYRAYTSQMVIDIYRERDQQEIFTVDQAIETIYEKGYEEVLVVPTLIINGEEYDQMMDALRPFNLRFEKMTVSRALLSSPKDYEESAVALIKELPSLKEKTAVVFLGHGAHHSANSAYPALDYIFKHRGYEHIYVGTVEGFPLFDDVFKDIEKGGYENILLMPLMLTAGDHAYNDMAGDEADSWKVLFQTRGYETDVILKGMGEFTSIQNIFIENAREALDKESLNQ